MILSCACESESFPFNESACSYHIASSWKTSDGIEYQYKLHANEAKKARTHTHTRNQTKPNQMRRANTHTGGRKDRSNRTAENIVFSSSIVLITNMYIAVHRWLICWNWNAFRSANRKLEWKMIIMGATQISIIFGCVWKSFSLAMALSVYHCRSRLIINFWKCNWYSP